MRRTATILLVALSASVAACAPEDPYSADRGDRGARQDEQLRRAQAGGDELTPPAVASDSAPPYAGVRAGEDPERVLRDFCAQWANWSYRTIGRQQRRLAELSTDQLADTLAPTSSQRGLDTTLARDRFAVRGAVVAINLEPGATRRRALCVTREEELEQGRDPLGDGVHRVYFARLARSANRWSVAAWQPQP